MNNIVEQIYVINMKKDIDRLEKIKNKYTMYAMAGMAFIAGTGWLSGHSLSFSQILKFLGM